MKRITALTLIVLTLFSLIGCGEVKTDSGKIKIISTIFPMYDFAKVIAGEKGEVSMLLPPSGESHSFEPTPKDIVNISESDLFIYVGGHSDNWIEEMIETLDKKPKDLKAINIVDPIKNDHNEADEHIWTTPENAKLISSAICENLCDISPENSEYFKSNLESYLKELEALDIEILNVVENSKRKTLVFGDKFPFRYFAEKYSIKCYSAYSDCGSEGEPSARLVADITDIVKKEKIPVILYIEFSNAKVANTIAKETNTKAMEFHSAHNVTKDELKNNISYVDIMKKNINVLKEALN